MFAKTCLISVMLAALTACGQSERTAVEQSPARQSAPTPTSEFRLPVSLNEVMVAMVNNAADPIWMAAWRSPETDADWRALERQAYQLELAGALIAFPGTGAMDDKWAAKPKWRAWADRLRDTGANAVVAVRDRDMEAISRVGDDIVEICEGCHVDFKLPYPTAGKFGELSPTPSDFEETPSDDDE